MMIKELNDFISCSLNIENSNTNSNNEEINKKFNSDEIMKNKDENKKCIYICRFIDLLFEELEFDDEIFNKCTSNVQKMQNIMIHDILEDKYKKYLKREDQDGIMGKSKIISVGELDEEFNKEEELYNLEQEERERDEYVIQKGKEAYIKKHGYNPTQDELETIKYDAIHNMDESMMYEQDLMDIGPRGKEVLDQGADYGGLTEFDFEDGEGFDYSDEMVYEE
jgi:hypothetical protein